MVGTYRGSSKPNLRCSYYISTFSTKFGLVSTFNYHKLSKLKIIIKIFWVLSQDVFYQNETIRLFATWMLSRDPLFLRLLWFLFYSGFQFDSKTWTNVLIFEKNLCFWLRFTADFFRRQLKMKISKKYKGRTCFTFLRSPIFNWLYFSGFFDILHIAQKIYSKIDFYSDVVELKIKWVDLEKGRKNVEFFLKICPLAETLDPSWSQYMSTLFDRILII